MNESKKLISVLLSLMITLSLSGCNFSQKSSTNSENTQVEDTLLGENEILQERIARLETTIEELRREKNLLEIQAKSQEKSYREAEIFVIEKIHPDGKKSYKIVSAEDYSDGFDFIHYLKDFERIYGSQTNLGIYEKKSFFYKTINNENQTIIAHTVNLRLANQSDLSSELPYIVGFYEYIFSEGEAQTTISLYRDYKEETMLQENTGDCNKIALISLIDVIGQENSKPTWEQSELLSLEKQLNTIERKHALMPIS